MKDYLGTAYTQVQDTLKLANIHQVPRITQVVVNVGVGKKRDDAKYLAAVVNDLKLICGQAPHERRSRQAVAGFSMREGDLVGYRVTMRGKRAAQFTERLIKLALPRVRDFRGVPMRVFDGRGNLSIGLREQLAFPEVRADKTDIIFGLQVTFVTTAETNEQAEVLFRALGFPLADVADDTELEIDQPKKKKKGAKK